MGKIIITGGDTYNIGDCLLSNNSSMIQKIINSETYANTFMYRYFKTIRNKDVIYDKQNPVFIWPTKIYDYTLHTESNIPIAADIISKMAQTGPATNIPPKDSLIIHIRLGDIFNLTNTIYQYDKLLPNTEQLLEGIYSTKKTKIIIVTALHHTPRGPISQTERYSNVVLPKQQYDHFIGQSNEKSIEYLTNFMGKIPEHFTVSIRSSANIDADFTFLCLADELLLSGQSTFGLAAKIINDYLKK